ncbi:MAG TPA: hypothetical protein VH880_00555 [Anaeromyxobacteraceae bacterium]|jgi:hypothetical protein
MSAELWRGEIGPYAFMILNVLGVAAALAWAWRRGLFCGLDAEMEGCLEPGRDGAPGKEHRP